VIKGVITLLCRERGLGSATNFPGAFCRDGDGGKLIQPRRLSRSSADSASPYRLGPAMIGNTMTIGTLVENDPWIEVFDEKGSLLTRIWSGPNQGDGLQGFTGSTVSVRNGASILVFDEKGHQISTVFSGVSRQSAQRSRVPQRAGLDLTGFFRQRAPPQRKSETILDRMVRALIKLCVLIIILATIDAFIASH
jgi:hypothetical protein